jgi:uncharacterized membrane protein YesL
MRVPFLDEESTFMDLLEKFADLAILSMLFFLVSIPVITLGASLSALYEAIVTSVRGKKAYPYKVFWKSFRKNWGVATPFWLLYVLAMVLLVFNVGFALHQYNNMGVFMLVVDVTVFVLLGFQIIYTFALIAKGYQGFSHIMKMAFMYGIAHLPYSVLALVILLIGVFFVTVTYGVLGVLLPGFIGALISLPLEKVFEKHIEEEEEGENEEE